MGYLSDCESDADFECMIQAHREVDAMIEDTHRQRAATENDPAYHATILEAARERARMKLSRRAAEQDEFRQREFAENQAALEMQRQAEEAAAMEQAFRQGVHDYHVETGKGLRVARATEQYMNTVNMIADSERAELANALGPAHPAVQNLPFAPHVARPLRSISPFRSVSPPPARGLFRPPLMSPKALAEVDMLQRDMVAAHIRASSPPPLHPALVVPPPPLLAPPLPVLLPSGPPAAQSFHFVRHGTAAKSRAQSDADGETTSPGGGGGRDGPWVRSHEGPSRHEHEEMVLRGVTDRIAIDLVLVAPLAKSLRMALAAFGGRNIPIVAHPGLHQQFTASTNPLRSDLNELYPEVDFSALDPTMAQFDAAAKGFGWLGVKECDPDFFNRVEALRESLLGRPERSIALVGAGEVLVRLSGVSLHHCQVLTVPRSAVVENRAPPPSIR